MIRIDNKFSLKQTVYLKTDRDQLPRLVTAIKVCPDDLLYELIQGTTSSYHYDFEISESADVLMTTTN
ncbi:MULTISPECIES: hypothetical protein [unclassified Spirosoma]|uniref:hypothetical protein n=1 Tax=unclassified Spirosoma TaxID=2621999 RepID=UPI00095A2708|nr:MULTISPECIES: hypothetical protein [unclassified Spirosoma]MBN8821292.1 hypothetical protein [Spirosoma sp.]OJW78081.1 MAG: hypothetical protein BGO59_29115 [Spirosoma sp. 48-14]